MGTRNDPLALAFGSLLRELRQGAGLTLAELGAKVSPPMQVQAVARYEAGGRVPTLDALYRLAAALGKTPCDLLPDAPPKARGRKT